MRHYDIAIIGSGPAGISAAIVASESGLKTAVFDEQHQVGGQIYRALEKTPIKDRTMLGKDYWDGEDLIEKFNSSDAHFFGGCTVWDISEDNIISYRTKGSSKQVCCKHLILATGALERSIPFEGWDLGGIFTAGAGQVLLKDSGAIVKDTVLVGSGPLIDVLAHQYIKAGHPPKAIVDTTPYSNHFKACKKLTNAIKGAGYLKKGLSLKASIKMHGVKVYTNCKNIRATGAQQIENIQFSQFGKDVVIPTDSLMIHFGVIPNINITRALGVDIYWDENQQCYRPVVDESFRTNRENTYMVGDAIGILGAKSASINGQIAAYDIANNEKAKAILKKESRKDAAIRPFLEQLFRIPSVDDLQLTPDTIICKCESITLAEIEKAIEVGAQSLNEIKSFTRSGMGPCQGRQCGNIIAMISAGKHKVSARNIEYYKTRSPYVPITFAEMSDNK
ncbi:FAD-dependent oxidoreductase [Photobacterium satsumensis]|uniref:FAD-dependent oxidoreductase n=1 Tax=Photobacterium satsumensis TaxID=2910239 RepID=UPI003D0F245D